MKKIEQFQIIGMTISGFKSYEGPTELTFGDPTVITGGNGRGKTSIADAIAFAVTGLPFFGERGIDRLHNESNPDVSIQMRFVDERGDIYDVVAGTFMVVGLTDDSFGSLTVEQMQKFSDLFKVPEQFVKLGDKIVAIPMISKEQQKQESVEQKDFEMNADTSGLTVAGHIGTWHTIDQHEVGGHSFYLMEHDAYGDEAACIIVDERGKLVLDDVYNGFDDDTLRLLDLEVKEVSEMPDPALSVQDMKDYGYAWAGVLPAGQEAAEKALENGCEVYRLYSDNTEGLCVDAKEIADHAAKGGMLGISKESWMAALEKENYLKAAEMSMEDDYGMIDGIINNGPKEGKTAEVKAPERGEKSSIMDRLKSAKAEKQKECCPPKKHKGEIEL